LQVLVVVVERGSHRFVAGTGRFHLSLVFAAGVPADLVATADQGAGDRQARVDVADDGDSAEQKPGHPTLPCCVMDGNQQASTPATEEE
jgi:hypothetical protein